jgi:hypothetical protein
MALLFVRIGPQFPHEPPQALFSRLPHPFSWREAGSAWDVARGSKQEKIWRTMRERNSRIDESLLRLARLIGRQIALEQFKRKQAKVRGRGSGVAHVPGREESHSPPVADVARWVTARGVLA